MIAAGILRRKEQITLGAPEGVIRHMTTLMAFARHGCVCHVGSGGRGGIDLCNLSEKNRFLFKFYLRTLIVVLRVVEVDAPNIDALESFIS